VITPVRGTALRLTVENTKDNPVVCGRDCCAGSPGRLILLPVTDSDAGQSGNAGGSISGPMDAS
jgi:hypothetical protein